MRCAALRRRCVVFDTFFMTCPIKPYPHSRADRARRRETSAKHECGSDSHILRGFAARSPKIVGILSRDKGLAGRELAANLSWLHIRRPLSRASSSVECSSTPFEVSTLQKWCLPSAVWTLGA